MASAVAFLLVAAAGVFKLEQAREKDEDEAETRGPKSLIGCLHGLHGAVLGHKVISGKELEQLTPYVGGEGGEPGQTLGHYGVVGAAILRGAPVSMERAKGKKGYREYVETLTRDYFVPPRRGPEHAARSDVVPRGASEGR